MVECESDHLTHGGRFAHDADYLGLQHDVYSMDNSFSAWVVRKGRPDGEVLR